MGANPNLIKEVNINVVREKLRSLRQATKQELAAHTGISAVTVGSVLKDMIETGEVRECGMIPSKGGRPSHVYGYNKDYSQIVIIYTYHLNDKDIASIRVYNLFDECLYQREAAIEDVCLEHFDTLLAGALEKHPAIKAMGFSLPGEESGGRLTVIDYPKLKGVAFTRYFSEKYGMPVLLENDINAAVIGYHRKSAAEQCLVGIYFPKKYRVGAGLVVGGKLVSGVGNFAGEIAYLPLDFDWTQPGTKTRQEMRDLTAKIVATYSCILAPEEIVVYSEQFDEKDIAFIRSQSALLLDELFDPNVALSKEFAEDCQCGLSRLTFGLLDTGIILKEKDKV